MAKSGNFYGMIKHPGALTRKAQAAGMSLSEYANAHLHDPGQTGKQARFYKYMLSRSARGKRS